MNVKHSLVSVIDDDESVRSPFPTWSGRSGMASRRLRPSRRSSLHRKISERRIASSSTLACPWYDGAGICSWNWDSVE